LFFAKSIYVILVHTICLQNTFSIKRNGIAFKCFEKPGKDFRFLIDSIQGGGGINLILKNIFKVVFRMVSDIYNFNTTCLRSTPGKHNFPYTGIALNPYI